MSEPKTIYDKIWESHLVYEDNNDCLLYIDRHLIHEVTSPQAFEGLRMSNRSVRKPLNALAVADHIIHHRLSWGLRHKTSWKWLHPFCENTLAGQRIADKLANHISNNATWIVQDASYDPEWHYQK